MAIMRPGGFDVTDRGIELAGLKAGCRVLDVGCGEGDTVDHLEKEKGMRAEGIDMNLARIAGGKERFPGIGIRFGDGEFLDDYMSFTFDGVFMEYALSLINMPDEALHEAYCVLKKGGKLIVSDFYEKDPDPQQMRAVRMEAERQSRIPHKEGDCEDRGAKFVDFRFGGAFYRDRLIRQLEETGFCVIAFEDRSGDLEAYLNEQAAAGEKPARGERAAGGKTPTRAEALGRISPDLETGAGGRDRSIGSFLLVAAKPL